MKKDPLDTLRTLSPEELAKIKPISNEMIDWCLKKGALEAAIAVPRRGANIDQLEYEYRAWLKANPKPES